MGRALGGSIGMTKQRDRKIGRCLFTDGPREVYEDSQGQYVFDYHGMRVYGVWILRNEDIDSSPCVVNDGEE